MLSLLLKIETVKTWFEKLLSRLRKTLILPDSFELTTVPQILPRSGLFTKNLASGVLKCFFGRVRESSGMTSDCSLLLSQAIESFCDSSFAKTGHIGKLVVLLFHNKTKISIICPTKSLNIAIKQLPERLENFLKRNKFESIINGFELNSEINVFTTKDRSTLAFMNQICANIECHLSERNSLENVDYSYLEDIHTEYLFSINGKAGKYETTIDIINRLMSYN